MQQCNWDQSCEEPGEFRVVAVGRILGRDEVLCTEHANRTRDNLIAAGCTVTLTVAPLTCDYEHELWGPHEGCREFMDEPEAIIRCGKPATRRYRVMFHGPCGDELEVLDACDEHSIESDLYSTVESVVQVG